MVGEFHSTLSKLKMSLIGGLGAILIAGPAVALDLNFTPDLKSAGWRMHVPRGKQAAEFLIENLERDQSPESLLLGEEHRSHSALAKRLHELVPAQEERPMPGQQFLCMPRGQDSSMNQIGGKRTRRGLLR